MHKFRMCLAITGTAVLFTGCGMQSGSPKASVGGVAVVDLDKLAQHTGKSEEMKEALIVQENSMKQQLQSFQVAAKEALQSKLDDIKDKGDTATDVEKREVIKFKADAENQLARGQNEAATKLNQYNQNQIAKFRAELKPLLQECAAKRGLAVVIPKNEGLLLSVEPGVDITEDVIKAYSAKRPAATPSTSAAKAPAQAESKPAAPARPKPTERAAKETDSDSRN